MIASMLLLATEGVEGVSPDHIAADLSVPIAIVIFCGAVFALLWSNYGAKKGALIYGVAAFGFCGVIGVFWWFGAPGTPVATGLQNFPGQTADEYQPKWFPFEAGSERSEFFSTWETFTEDNPGDFMTVDEFVGTTDIEDPMYASVRGDLDSASQLMIAQYLSRNDEGGIDIGASFRTQLQDATPPAEAGDRFLDWVAEVAVENETAQNYVAIDNGQRVAASEVVVYATYEKADPVEVARTVWFAYKDPGAIWLPSAVWTLVSFLLFGVCLALLDRVEMREKREGAVAEEAMDVQVPISQ